jgi:hypothetical protein
VEKKQLQHAPPCLEIMSAREKQKRVQGQIGFIKPPQRLGYPARKKIQNDPMQLKAKISFKWTGQNCENGKEGVVV